VTAAQHTPGPWDIERELEGALTVIYAGAEPVANLCATAEEEANARLMRAAPDMLKALEQAVRYARRGEAPPEADWGDWATIIHAIKATAP